MDTHTAGVRVSGAGGAQAPEKQQPGSGLASPLRPFLGRPASLGTGGNRASSPQSPPRASHIQEPTHSSPLLCLLEGWGQTWAPPHKQQDVRDPLLHRSHRSHTGPWPYSTLALISLLL